MHTPLAARDITAGLLGAPSDLSDAQAEDKISAGPLLGRGEK